MGLAILIFPIWIASILIQALVPLLLGYYTKYFISSFLVSLTFNMSLTGGQLDFLKRIIFPYYSLAQDFFGGGGGSLLKGVY
jgi:hypothetical protein